MQKLMAIQCFESANQKQSVVFGFCIIPYFFKTISELYEHAVTTRLTGFPL